MWLACKCSCIGHCACWGLPFGGLW